MILIQTLIFILIYSLYVLNSGGNISPIISEAIKILLNCISTGSVKVCNLQLKQFR